MKKTFQPYLTMFFDFLEKGRIFNEKQLVENGEWLTVLKLPDPLRDFLQERFAQRLR